MMTLQEVQKRLENANLTFLSGELKISRPTLIKLKKGDKNVRLETFEAVSDYYEQLEAKE